MNRKLVILFVILALGLAIFNITLVDFEDPFQGESLIACIGIMASLCALVLLLIFATAKKIEQKLKDD